MRAYMSDTCAREQGDGNIARVYPNCLHHSEGAMQTSGNEAGGGQSYPSRHSDGAYPLQVKQTVGVHVLLLLVTMLDDKTYCCDMFCKVVAVEQNAHACIVLVSPCQKKSHVARVQLLSLHKFCTRPFFIRPQTLGAAAFAVGEEQE